VLWNLPFGGVLLYPFKLLATWIHELSHGVVMLLSGAGFDRMCIYRDTSGLAYASHAASPYAAAPIAAAGYMGTPLWGAALLVVTGDARDARTARRALLVVAALLLLTSIVVVANDFGRWAMIAMGGGVAAAAIVLPARGKVAVAHFLAAQACVNALLDIRVLLRPSQVVDGQVAGASDAHNMALATFGTTERWAVWTWAVLWLAWSLLLLFVALRVVARQRLRASAAAEVSPRP
jgi:hypothetical protein